MKFCLLLTFALINYVHSWVKIQSKYDTSKYLKRANNKKDVEFSGSTGVEQQWVMSASTGSSVNLKNNGNNPKCVCSCGVPENDIKQDCGGCCGGQGKVKYLSCHYTQATLFIISGDAEEKWHLEPVDITDKSYRIKCRENNKYLWMNSANNARVDSGTRSDERDVFYLYNTAGNKVLATDIVSSATGAHSVDIHQLDEALNLDSNEHMFSYDKLIYFLGLSSGLNVCAFVIIIFGIVYYAKNHFYVNVVYDKVEQRDDDEQA